MLKKKGQGTIEYLTILGVVVVISLFLVAFLMDILGSPQELVASQQKTYWQGQNVLLSEAVADDEGDSVFLLQNNTDNFMNIIGYTLDDETKIFNNYLSLPPFAKRKIYIMEFQDCEGTCSYENVLFHYLVTGSDKTFDVGGETVVPPKKESVSHLDLSADGDLICVENGSLQQCSETGGSANDTNFETAGYDFGDYLRNDGDTATGDYTFDTDTLHIDSTNHRVGIGTTGPDGLFQVDGSSGTQSTANSLMTLRDSTSNIAFQMGATNGYGWIRAVDQLIAFKTYGNLLLGHNYVSIGDGADNKQLYIDTLNKYVGIGTDSPDEKLEVDGNVLAENFIANIIWADKNRGYGIMYCEDGNIVMGYLEGYSC